MTFLGGRKRLRRRSPSHRSPLSKLVRLNSLRYDGTSSQKSVESTSTATRSGLTAIKEKFFTRVHKSSKPKFEDESLLTQDQPSLVVVRTGLAAGFSPPNDSNDTTVVSQPLWISLKGEEAHVAVQSAPPTPGGRQRPRGPPIAAQDLYNLAETRAHELAHSQSNPAMHKFSQKLFGAPTVIRRPDLGRPSIFASTPSTYHTDSGSSPGRNGAPKSSPPTSDTPPSPASVIGNQSIASADLEQAFPFTSGNNLSGTIVSAEATASAKIYFETYYKTLLKGSDARQNRREQLEGRLDALQLPDHTKYRVRKTWAKHESHNLRLNRKMLTAEVATKEKVSIAAEDYEVLKVLGKGSFGVVRLVRGKSNTPVMSRTSSAMHLMRHPSRSAAREALAPLAQRRVDLSKVRKEVHAMKVIRKSDMLQNSQEGHLRAERDFLVAAEGSQWVVPLHAAFQDDKFLYLVMDFCIGGDFLGLLIRKNILSEEITKWYVAEMILCVEEAHRMRWIHRDVKPDNFLIGADGHLKISDFGLAFDGQWEHDQKFFHNHRHNMLEKLKIEVIGDEQDQQEQEEMDNASRIAQTFAGKHFRSSKTDECHADDNGSEPILDYRTRTQQRHLARSVVGTSQYMAPEVIRGDMYDGRCD